MSRYEFDDDEPYVVIERHEGGVGTFLVGLAVGAGIALLLAPRSGEETRRDIQQRARKARRAARRMADEVTGTVSDTFQDARRQLVLRTFASTGGDLARAAKLLGVTVEEIRSELYAVLDGSPAEEDGKGVRPPETAGAVSAPSAGIGRPSAPAATKKIPTRKR